MRVAVEIALSNEEIAYLSKPSKSRSVPARLAGGSDNDARLQTFIMGKYYSLEFKGMQHRSCL